MKKTYLALSLAAATLFVTACGDENQATAAASTADTTTTAPASNSSESVAGANAATINAQSPFEDKVSYSVGASVGTYISAMQRDQSEFIGTLDNDLVIKGFIDALGSKTALTEEEITQTLMDLDQKVRTAIEEKQKVAAQKNLDDGKKFLEENAKKDGVKVTESGLQYQIIEEGKGKSPTPNDVVRVKYKGTTIDGQVFDEQTDPISFPLSSIIPGWTEGLQLMKEGGKAKLFIPADLAYGELGAGDLIKPNSTLVFDIELVEVLPASDAGQPASAASDAAAGADATN